MKGRSIASQLVRDISLEETPKQKKKESLWAEKEESANRLARINALKKQFGIDELFGASTS